jgi:hypothetical protein
MEARQIEQGNTMFCGERRQHRIKGMTIGKQRMQNDQIGALARSYRGQCAAAGTQLLHVHKKISPTLPGKE